MDKENKGLVKWIWLTEEATEEEAKSLSDALNALGATTINDSIEEYDFNYEPAQKKYCPRHRVRISYKGTNIVYPKLEDVLRISEKLEIELVSIWSTDWKILFKNYD
jgi:hypothetical protein